MYCVGASDFMEDLTTIVRRMIGEMMLKKQDLHINIADFFYIGPHIKFQNQTCLLSCRKVRALEERVEKER